MKFDRNKACFPEIIVTLSHRKYGNQSWNRRERHYRSIFYVVFAVLGQLVRVEVRRAKGRADAVVYTPDAVYVFEFKLNGTAEQALKQIDEKGYLMPYKLDGKRRVKVGAAFDKETRNIGECRIVEE